MPQPTYHPGIPEYTVEEWDNGAEWVVRRLGKRGGAYRLVVSYRDQATAESIAFLLNSQADKETR